MANKECETAAASHGTTAETALELIESLPATERTKLFELLARHPENQPVKALVASATKLIESIKESQKGQVRLENNANLVIKYLEQTLQKNAKYTRGPKARSQPTQHRRELVWQMLDAGESDPRKIYKSLKQDHALKVELKTVRNDISLIRNGHLPSPIAAGENTFP